MHRALCGCTGSKALIMKHSKIANLTLITMLAVSLISCAPNAELSSETRQAPQTQSAASISPEVKQLKAAALASNIGYDIVESLTTEVGPRLGGTPEEARAREWAVAKFEELGLQNVRIEPFTVPGWIRGKETAHIVSPFEQPLYITSLGGSVATPASGITAPIAYFPTFEDLKNSPPDGLEGKIVFISGRMEKAPDGAGYGPANQKRRTGATEAGKRGALAVIIRSVGTDSHRFPHTGQMRYAEDVAPIPIGALSAPDADQLERILNRGEEITIKLTLTPEAIGDRPSGNVIGEIVGSEKPEEIVLIAGHLDSWDLGTGALDDGAGIGVSAGAAKIIIDSGFKPKRTIRVVAYGSEEIGLLGAYAYAARHKDELGNHILATESDFGSRAPYEVQIGAKAGHDVIRAMAQVMDLPMSDKTTTGGPDIIPLAAAGVPAMRFQQDGSDYFDFHHTPDDTLDKIDPKDMATNTAAFAVMAWMASEAETNFRSAPENEAETASE